MCEHTLTNICDSRKICRKNRRFTRVSRTKIQHQLCYTCKNTSQFLVFVQYAAPRVFAYGGIFKEGGPTVLTCCFSTYYVCVLFRIFISKNIGSCNFISTKFRTQPETGSDNNISDQQVRVCMDFMICLEISKKVCLKHSGGLDLGRSSQNTQLALR